MMMPTSLPRVSRTGRIPDLESAIRPAATPSDVSGVHVTGDVVMISRTWMVTFAARTCKTVTNVSSTTRTSHTILRQMPPSVARTIPCGWILRVDVRRCMPRTASVAWRKGCIKVCRNPP